FNRSVAPRHGPACELFRGGVAGCHHHFRTPDAARVAREATLKSAALVGKDVLHSDVLALFFPTLDAAETGAQSCRLAGAAAVDRAPGDVGLAGGGHFS